MDMPTISTMKLGNLGSTLWLFGTPFNHSGILGEGNLWIWVDDKLPKFRFNPGVFRSRWNLALHN